MTPWTRGFAVPPATTVELPFAVTAPPTARPGAHWWAAVKVACFGQVHYTETIPIEIAWHGSEFVKPDD
jgi:hypothetical protein